MKYLSQLPSSFVRTTHAEVLKKMLYDIKHTLHFQGYFYPVFGLGLRIILNEEKLVICCIRFINDEATQSLT